MSSPTCMAVRHLNITRGITGTLYQAAYWHNEGKLYMNIPIVGDTVVYIGTEAPLGLPEMGKMGSWDIIRAESNGSACAMYAKDLSGKWAPGQVNESLTPARALPARGVRRGHPGPAPPSRLLKSLFKPTLSMVEHPDIVLPLMHRRFGLYLRF